MACSRKPRFMTVIFTCLTFSEIPGRFCGWEAEWAQVKDGKHFGGVSNRQKFFVRLDGATFILSKITAKYERPKEAEVEVSLQYS